MQLNQVEIENAVATLKRAKEAQATVWLVGNGGSAATASHFANDLLKVCEIDAVAVADMVPSVLAFGNDNGWENMFSGVLEQTMKYDDVLVAISCGGESQNVLTAAELFRKDNLIILTGDDFESTLGLIKASAKVFVPHSEIRIQEDTHLAVCHAIVGALRNV